MNRILIILLVAFFSIQPIIYGQMIDKNAHDFWTRDLSIAWYGMEVVQRKVSFVHYVNNFPELVEVCAFAN